MVSSNKHSGFRISVLPTDMANKIAAGEVIERPASVVKELVENSIDAGSTRISVEIESAGKELIRVSDNGDGMNSEDAQRAFERHATSKVSRAEDLEGILTLGFRGEALPSVASVSRLRLLTCDDEQKGGTEVLVEGGTMKTARPTSRLKGTTLEVRQIFYNTPARKKFLKRDSTESTHITQVVTQQALANPQIYFNLSHNGRQVFKAMATDQFLYRISELLGSELVRELVPVEADNGRYRLEGFISSPVFTRSNNSSQYFYVNGRFIRDRVILHAIQHGYSHLLPKGQYPVIVLKFTMDPELVDVNVHPAKAEVRFAFQQEVHQFVSRSIKNAISQSEKILDPELFFVEKSSQMSIIDQQNRAETIESKAEPKPILVPSGYSIGISRKESPDVLYLGKSASKESVHLGTGFQMFEGKPLPVSNLIYSDFEPLGQLDNSFVVMQGPGGLLIVDQHIAHERVLYERFRATAKARNIEVQQLLFPASIQFSPSEWEALNGQLDTLTELGVHLEPFGGDSFLLRAVPAILKHDDHEKLLRDIVEELRDGDGSRSVEERYEELIIMMACRNAIKINHSLDEGQVRKLIFDLAQTEMPYTCPHGRPIALLMEMDTILKRFLRK
tara:strand:+ start:520 stop:2373 length:1854 start_codon:yes stop_codon:yes gene_type:complete